MLHNSVILYHKYHTVSDLSIIPQWLPNWWWEEVVGGWGGGWMGGACFAWP